MTASQQPEMRKLTIRLTEDQLRDLKFALLKNGSTAQRVLSRYVDRYIETFREET